MSKITIGHLTTLMLTFLAFTTSLNTRSNPATVATPNQNALAPKEQDPAAAAAGVFGSPGFLNKNNVFSASLVNASSQSSTGDSNLNMMVSSNSDKNTVKTNGDLNGNGGNIINNSLGNSLVKNTTATKKAPKKNKVGATKNSLNSK